MDYQDGKHIVESLDVGVKTGVAARFVPADLPHIQNLIEARMVVTEAFSGDAAGRYQTQNLAERSPVTPLGRQMFG